MHADTDTAAAAAAAFALGERLTAARAGPQPERARRTQCRRFRVRLARRTGNMRHPRRSWVASPSHWCGVVREDRAAVRGREGGSGSGLAGARIGSGVRPAALQGTLSIDDSAANHAEGQQRSWMSGDPYSTRPQCRKVMFPAFNAVDTLPREPLLAWSWEARTALRGPVTSSDRRRVTGGAKTGVGVGAWWSRVDGSRCHGVLALCGRCVKCT